MKWMEITILRHLMVLRAHYLVSIYRNSTKFRPLNPSFQSHLFHEKSISKKPNVHTKWGFSEKLVIFFPSQSNLKRDLEHFMGIDFDFSELIRDQILEYCYVKIYLNFIRFWLLISLIVVIKMAIHSTISTYFLNKNTICFDLSN